MSIVELNEVKRHLHYAVDNSNDVSLKSFIVAADAIIKNYITDNFGSEYPSAALLHKPICKGFFSDIIFK